MKKNIKTIYLTSLYEELGNSNGNPQKISSAQKNFPEVSPVNKLKETSGESTLSDLTEKNVSVSGYFTTAPQSANETTLTKDKSDQINTSTKALKLDSFGFLNTLNETNSLNSAHFILLARRIIQLKQELTKDAEKLKVTGLGLNSL
jgi:hypothetical protein